MKPEQIKDAIQITVHHPTRDQPFTLVKANISFNAVARISEEESKMAGAPLIRFVENQLKEKIMRQIFADQRKEIHEAIMELALCTPYSAKYYAISDKLMNLAIRGGVEL